MPKVHENEEKPQRLTLWQVTCSVLAAAFGVQSTKNRERDFKHAKPSTYIIAGLIFTILFVLAIFMVVSLVLKHVAS